jgi:hypothetical protein
MTQAFSFGADLSLRDLAKRLAQFEALAGALVALGNQDGVTIGEYDDDRDGGGGIALRTGPPLPAPPGPVIASGTVFILGQLQRVTAYRA